MTGLAIGEGPVPSMPGRLLVLPGAQQGAVSSPALCEATVIENRNVGDRYWLLRMRAPEVAAVVRPGQFVMLTVAREGEWDPVLPRPMAVFDSRPEEGEVDVIYGVVGRGTERLVRRRSGARIVTVGPLGKGFHLAPETRRVLLFGRGIGTCSLSMLAAAAVGRWFESVVVESARTPHALVGRPFFTRLPVTTLFSVTDRNGSSDPTVLEARLRRELAAFPPDQIFVCGSDRLLRLAGRFAGDWGPSVQVSVEAHMACGLGYCHGCSSGLRVAGDEAPLVCKDGPVFGWVPWDTAL